MVSFESLIMAQQLILEAKIQIVDQTLELETFYAVDEHDLPPPEIVQSTERPNTLNSLPRPPGLGHPRRHYDPIDISPISTGVRDLDAFRSPTVTSHDSFDGILPYPGNKRRRTDESLASTEVLRPVQLPPIPYPKPPMRDSPSSASLTQSTYYGSSYASPNELNETRRIEAEYARLADTEAAKIPDEPLLSFSNWKKNFAWPNQYTTQQCICLFKYYIDVLGPWVSSKSHHHPANNPVRRR